jgi:Transmembrane amino acid transporter protein
MYPATSIFIAVGQLAIAILVLFSYPLQVHPCRNCLDKVFHFGESLNAVKPIVHGDEEEEDDDDDDDHSHSEMSKTKHFWLTMAIVASGFMIALMVDDLQIGTYFLLGDFVSDVNF